MSVYVYLSDERIDREAHERAASVLVIERDKAEVRRVKSRYGDPLGLLAKNAEFSDAERTALWRKRWVSDQ